MHFAFTQVMFAWWSKAFKCDKYTLFLVSSKVSLPDLSGNWLLLHLCSVNRPLGYLLSPRKLLTAGIRCCTSFSFCGLVFLVSRVRFNWFIHAQLSKRSHKTCAFRAWNLYPPPKKKQKTFSHLYKEVLIFSFNPLELNEGRGLCVRVSLCVSVRHWNARGSSGVGETLTSFTSTSSSLLGCGESTHAGEVNAVTWPPVAVGEFPPLWRKGQPCGWTVSPTPVLVLCLEGGVLFLIF